VTKLWASSSRGRRGVAAGPEPIGRFDEKQCEAATDAAFVLEEDRDTMLDFADPSRIDG
jgi:hypothetical protein